MDANHQHIKNTIDKIQSQSPIDCNTVDISNLEEMGSELASNMSSFIVNINMATAQFDADKFSDEALKLGIDL